MSGGTMTLPPGAVGTDLKMGPDGLYFGFDSGGGSTPSVTNPTIKNINTGPALSENSYALPSGTMMFAIKTRIGRSLRLAFETGKLTTEWITVRGTYEAFNLLPSASVTLFFACDVAGIDVEIVTWT